MAKKKYDDALPIEDVMTEEFETEEVEEVVEETSDIDKFINTQLTIINKMTNPAKARRVAERVLRNRKGK